MSLLLFFSCDNSPQTTDNEKIVHKIYENGEPRFAFVYSSRADDATYRIAVDLRDRIKEMTGVDFEFRSDKLKDNEGYDSGKYEILIGETQHPESAKIFEEIKVNDYKVCISGNKIIIAGYTSEMLQKAANYFLNEGIKKEDDNGVVKKVSFAQSASREYKSDYQINSFAIDGTELRNFRIVYGSSADSSYKAAAQNIAKSIENSYGCRIDTVSDLSEPAKHEIIIGQTNRTSGGDTGYLNYRVTVSDGRLIVQSGGAYSIGVAANKFIGLFAKDDNKNISCKGDFDISKSLIDSKEYPLGGDADIRVMSVNILAEYESWSGTTPVITRGEIFMANLEFYSPDAVGIQEMSPAWVTFMKKNLDSGKWALLGVNSDTENTNFTTILYRCDKYDVVEWKTFPYSKGNNSRCRIVTWGVFRDKTTGKTFSLANTHWDGSDNENTMQQIAEFSATILNIQNKYSCPVLTTGDYNSNETSKAYKEFLPKANMVDAKFTAKNMINNIGSWHGLDSSNHSTNSCDHIFATKNVAVTAFQTLVMNAQIHASDHAWIYADIDLDGAR